MIAIAGEELRMERDRFVAFAFASADILFELSEVGEIIFIGGATNGFLGKKPKDLEGKNFKVLLSDNEQESADQLLEGLKKLQRIDKIEVSMKGRDNKPLPVILSGFRLGHVHNHMYFAISVIREDDSECGEIFRRDMYSGLLRKESYIVETNKKIKEAQENGEELNMTLLDFPELKTLLDELPPEPAAELMSEIGEYLREISIDGDTASLIGEESYSFIHNKNINEKEITAKILEITKKADPKGIGIETSISTIKTDPAHLSEYDSANALLYTINKFAEGNNGSFNLESLSDSYEIMLEETIEKISSFKETVDTIDFDIAYQPIVDLRTGIIHHYEALLRLKDENSKFSNPFDFITFGEQSGVIGDFDLAMAQKALDALSEMLEKKHRPIVAINLSGKSLSSTLFMDAFAGLLEQNPKIRKQLIVEITESSKIQDIKSANRFIQRLRDAGNPCCLDDFGVGESSFDYLRNLHVDYVKIDGSYVKESLQTRRGREMLKAMASLCRDLEMMTIGEFVEDQKAATLLWECGVRFGQGWLFGKPDTNQEVLENCGTPCKTYRGVMQAKKISNQQREWWAKKS